jgi:hypothetical protein
MSSISRKKFIIKNYRKLQKIFLTNRFLFDIIIHNLCAVLIIKLSKHFLRWNNL